MRYEEIHFLEASDANLAFEIMDEDGDQAALDYMKEWYEEGDSDMRDDLMGAPDDEIFKADGFIMGWDESHPYIWAVYDTEFDSENPCAPDDHIKYPVNYDDAEE